MRRPYRYLVRDWYEDGETYEALFKEREAKRAIDYFIWCSQRPLCVKIVLEDLWGDPALGGVIIRGGEIIRKDKYDWEL